MLGGSGNGEQMSANKVAGIRAALCYNEELASLAREHNDARVISIGARMHSGDEAKAMVRTFLATPYSNDPRHQRRIDMLRAYEKSGTCRHSRVLWIEPGRACFTTLGRGWDAGPAAWAAARTRAGRP